MAVRGFVHEADHVARAAAFWKKIHRAEIHGNNEPRMPVAPSRLRIGAATNVAVRAAKERKNETFAERKATLVGLNETFAERKATLVGLNETFAERKATLVGLNETLAERKATLPVLICLTAGIVFLACGPAALAQYRARPAIAAPACPILVTQLPAGGQVEKEPSACSGMLRACYGDGARIVLVAPDQSARLMSAAFSSACDPTVSFDGKRFLFAGKRSPTDGWNIYEMAIDGSGIRQITKGLGDCRNPGYQSTQYRITADAPWHQYTFVSTGHKTLNEYGDLPAMSLYSCRTDGSDVRRLTHNLSSDFDPTILWDGRLLFASWQRARLEHGPLGRVGLFGIGTDGAEFETFFLEGGKRIKHMPCTTPTGLAVFVESDRVPWDGAGTLGCVELRRPLHSYRPLTVEADGLFHSPSPLPDGRILVSRRPADGSAAHALYRFDPRTKRLEAIFNDRRWHQIQAKAVYAQPEPDGRASVVGETGEMTGKLYCLDLYTTDFADPAWLPRGSAKRLRVLEGVPRKQSGVQGEEDGSPAMLLSRSERRQTTVPSEPAGPLAIRRILGEIELDGNSQRPMDQWRALVGESENKGQPVPAERLGSFSLNVPGNTPIELQIVDEHGLVLRSCGWIWAKNHEPRGCIGCHEDGELTPENALPLAVTEPSISLTPPMEQRTSMDFRRDIMPIVAGKCAACHAKVQAPPQLGPNRPGVESGQAAYARIVYDALLATERASDGKIPFGKYVHPGRARTSPLVWHLFGKNTSRPWDGAAGRGIAKPIPPGPSDPLTEAEKQVIVKWIDLGAPWRGM